jgi:hypothetical protein
MSLPPPAHLHLRPLEYTRTCQLQTRWWLPPNMEARLADIRISWRPRPRSRTPTACAVLAASPARIVAQTKPADGPSATCMTAAQ